MNDLENIPISFSIVRDTNLIRMVLYGNNRFDDTINWKILMTTTIFINYSQ